MDIKRFTFRLPIDLYNQVDSIAKQNHRSLNSEIIIALEAYCQKYQHDNLPQSKPTNE